MLIERAGCWPLPVSGSSPRMDLPRWVWPLFPCKTKGQIFFQEWPEWQNEFLAGPKAMFGEQVLKRSWGEGLLLSSFLPIISSTFPQSYQFPPSSTFASIALSLFFPCFLDFPTSPSVPSIFFHRFLHFTNFFSIPIIFLLIPPNPLFPHLTPFPQFSSILPVSSITSKVLGVRRHGGGVTKTKKSSLQKQRWTYTCANTYYSSLWCQIQYEWHICSTSLAPPGGESLAWSTTCATLVGEVWELFKSTRDKKEYL